MSVMNYVSSEIKIIAVKHSLVGTESLNQSAARFGVSRSTLQKWLLNYEMFGTEGLCHRAGNHHYHLQSFLADFLLPLDEGFRYCSLHFSTHPFQLILVWIQTVPHFFSHFHK